MIIARAAAVIHPVKGDARDIRGEVPETMEPESDEVWDAQIVP